MEETLKMMKSILTGKEKEQDEKELIENYQKELLPNILAYFFTSNIGIIMKANKLYPILDEEDKASFCLQEMDKCLRNYNLENNNKFITYFVKCYKNRLRMETEQLLTQKRKAILNYEELNEITYNNTYEIESVDLLLENYTLSKTEKNLCQLLYLGYSPKEIAKKLCYNVATIYHYIHKIQQKIILET